MEQTGLIHIFPFFGLTYEKAEFVGQYHYLGAALTFTLIFTFIEKLRNEKKSHRLDA